MSKPCLHDATIADTAMIGVGLLATGDDTLLWDVGQASLRIDGVDQLWEERSGGLDWLDDYRCSVELDRTIEMLRHPPEETQEDDEHYVKSMLVTTGQDFAFDE